LQTQYRRYLDQQFSIAFDLYLAIRLAVHNFVQAALGRDSPDWRLRHACPACTYKLKDEHHLLYSLLFTMDGNDSLKRILRRIVGDDDMPGPSSERTDSRTIDNDFYLTRDYVDQWSDEAFENLMATENQVRFYLFISMLSTYLDHRMVTTTIHVLIDGRT
jgi:hypothetical protein